MSANAIFGPYTVALVAQAVTGGITLVQVKAGANRRVAITRAWCSQSNQTTSAQQRIQVVRKTAAATVTSSTPLLVNSITAAAEAVGGAAATGVNATAEGTDGDVLVHDVFNVLNGWIWIPTPEERPIVLPAGIIALKFPAAPGSSMTVSAGFNFYEF